MPPDLPSIGLTNLKMGAENQFVLFRMYISPPILPPYATWPPLAAPLITDTPKIDLQGISLH